MLPIEPLMMIKNTFTVGEGTISRLNWEYILLSS